MIAAIEFELSEAPEAFKALTRYLYVAPGVRPVTTCEVPDTERLSYPARLEIKSFAETSNLYPVATVIELQFAVKAVVDTLVAFVAFGAGGLRSVVVVFEFADAPDELLARTLK